MSERLKGKVALITGGTSGIGEDTARLFSQEGAQVVIVGRSEEKGKKIGLKLGKNVVYKKADITIEKEISDSVDFTINTFGKMDILFNNAGYGIADNVAEISQEQIDYGLGLLSSVILGIKYAVEPMKAIGGGCIINNSSVAGHVYGQGSPLYSSLKSAVSHYSRMAGVSLGPFNIRVNAISPGAIATPIFWGGSQRANTLSEKENERKMEKLKVNLAKAVPLAKTGLAEDISEAALYLASDAGRFVTCHDLVVDGGRSVAYNEPHQS
tara:strand:+ start:821 stop:1624 length:804 start_codon:yes stop_codon:yes gene_type:complete